MPPAPAPAPPAPAGGGVLAGRTIAIDPGHNGGNASAPGFINALVPAGGFSKPCDTTGTSTDAGYPEYAFTMDVASRLAGLLRAQGANVVLTRSDSSGVGPCVNVRAGIGNQANADAAISIHADGGPAAEPGFHVIAPGLAPDGGNAAILSRSAALARSVKVAFAAGTGEQTAAYEAPGLVVRNDLGGLNLSRVPKIFIECANMRNPSDAARATSAEWRQEAAGAIFNGLRTYLGG